MSDPRPDLYAWFPEPAAPPAVPPSNTSGMNAADQSAAAKARYEAELEGWMEDWKQRAADSTSAVKNAETRQDTEYAAETALLKAIHDAYVATTQSSLDRALTRMNVVTASVGAITTVYTGLLALVYAAKSGEGKALTIVGVVPALFLGLALFLVTIYAAMFRRQEASMTLLPGGIGGQIAEIRLVTFMQWCFGGVWARSWALHAGIVSMGIGLMTLPLPFVSAPTPFEVTVFVAGLTLVILTAVFSSALTKGKAWARRVANQASKLPF